MTHWLRKAAAKSRRLSGSATRDDFWFLVIALIGGQTAGRLANGLLRCRLWVYRLWIPELRLFDHPPLHAFRLWRRHYEPRYLTIFCVGLILLWIPFIRGLEWLWFGCTFPGHTAAGYASWCLYAGLADGMRMFVLRGSLGRVLARKLARGGKCPKCGYDLTGCTSDVCSECGMEVTSAGF